MSWDILTDAEFQRSLGFYAGGAAIVISGLWTAFITLRKKPKEPAPPKPQVAGGDGVVAGGDVMVEGGVHVHKTALPKGIIALFALGLVLLGIAVALPRCDVDATNAAVACRDLSAGDINIGTGQ